MLKVAVFSCYSLFLKFTDDIDFISVQNIALGQFKYFIINAFMIIRSTSLLNELGNVMLIFGHRSYDVNSWNQVTYVK